MAARRGERAPSAPAAAQPHPPRPPQPAPAAAGARGRRRPPPAFNPRPRQRRLGRWTLITGILATLSILGAALLARDAQAPAGPLPAAELRHPDPQGLTLVSVRRVIDGDTLDVTAGATVLRVRLFEVAASEHGERCADETARRLAELAGEQVRLRASARPQDEFGREAP